MSYIAHYAVSVPQTKGTADQIAHFRGRLLGKVQSLCGITRPVASELRFKESFTGIWVTVFNSCRWVKPPRIWLTLLGILQYFWPPECPVTMSAIIQFSTVWKKDFLCIRPAAQQIGLCSLSLLVEDTKSKVLLFTSPCCSQADGTSCIHPITAEVIKQNTAILSLSACLWKRCTFLCNVFCILTNSSSSSICAELPLFLGHQHRRSGLVCIPCSFYTNPQSSYLPCCQLLSRELEFSANLGTLKFPSRHVDLELLMDFLWLWLVFPMAPALYLLLVNCISRFLNFMFSFLSSLNLLAIGSLMAVPHCPGLDTNGLVILDLLLYRMYSFLLYQIYPHIQLSCSSWQFLSICLVQTPNFPAHRSLNDL